MSLKGAAYEHKHIREEYAVHRHDIITIHKAYFKFGIVNRLGNYLFQGLGVIQVNRGDFRNLGIGSFGRRPVGFGRRFEKFPI